MRISEQAKGLYSARRSQMAAFRRFTGRVFLTGMAMLLFVDARAEALLRSLADSDLNTPVQKSSQSEEESKTELKNEAVRDRRPCCHSLIPLRSVSWRQPLQTACDCLVSAHRTHGLPEHASDLRNGLGAPLLC